MVTAPHALAAQSGARILAEGGNAIEAALATAATLAAVYPHMTGLGGDAFWLIAEPQSMIVVPDRQATRGESFCQLPDERFFIGRCMTDEHVILPRRL